jgi:hypothetical protein
VAERGRISFGVGTNDDEINDVRGRSRLGFSRRSGEGATFNTSSRLNNQALIKNISGRINFGIDNGTHLA